MASPLIDYCEQTNPRVLDEMRRRGPAFSNALRVSKVSWRLPKRGR